MFRLVKGWARIGVTLAALLCVASVACKGGGGKNSRGKGDECPEIFAYGFRNPWRMNFDPQVGGKLYVGDVGQGQREEIDIVVSGGNYGWDCREGDLVHATTADCAGPFEDPEVVHDRTDAQAITGGVVYRGTAIPQLFGFYVYGDFQTGNFFAFDADVANDPPELLTAPSGPQVSAFGQARNGDIFAVTFDSVIYRFVSTGAGVQAVDLVNAFPGRTFDQPVKLVQHPTDATRWYVVEQDGLVRTFQDTNSNAPTPAADVDALINLGSGLEQGLLGMAFDPNYNTSREVYFAYTNNGAGTVELARWKTANDGLTFTPDSPAVVLSIPHPDDNHNGGDILFGRDGFLYYSMGDGGGSDDPDDNGQDKTTLLGKILRIDVNSTPEAGKAYSVPPSNPYAGNKLCDGTSRP